RRRARHEPPHALRREQGVEPGLLAGGPRAAAGHVHAALDGRAHGGARRDVPRLHRRGRAAVRLHRPRGPRPAAADSVHLHRPARRPARLGPVLGPHRGGRAQRRVGPDQRGAGDPGGGAVSPHIAKQQPQEHRPRGRFRPRANWGILLWLTAVWVALWGDLSLANVVIGAFLAVLVTAVLPLPSTPFDGRFRPWGVVLLLAYFLWDVVKASVEVAALAVRRKPPRGAVIRV